MEFLKSARRRSRVSDVLYITLNVLLAFAILGIVWAIESPLPALVLVLLSKWRVFAVRPRYWRAHVVSNLIDIIVSVGFVALLYAATGAIVAQVVITLLYIGWLLFLKPASKRRFVVAQAGVGLFVGITAATIVAADWYVSVVVALFWLIGFAAARHVLVAYERESHVTLLSLIWGFVMAEIGWLLYHWTIAYPLPGIGDIQLPQVSIIALTLSFLAERVYASYHHNDEIRLADILLPLLFSLSLIALLLLFFNDTPTSLS